MDTLIASSSATFMTTTGFSLASVVTFATDQMLVVIGSGLAVLQALIPWIVALAVIGAIVAFLFRAFSFFKH